MKRFIIFSIFIILLLAFLVFFYFYSVWIDEHNMKKQMINKAYENVQQLHSIDDINFFTGDKHYYFILGKSTSGSTILVWVNEEEIHYKYLYNWVTKGEITKKALKDDPNITIKRISMGINNKEELIYEILFEDEDGRIGYQYYRLETGELIKTYKLGKLR